MENNNLAGTSEKRMPLTVEDFNLQYSYNVIFSESREYYIENRGQMTKYRLNSPVIFWNELSTDEKLDIIMLVFTNEYSGLSLGRVLIESVGLEKHINNPKEIK